jgi:hypothetical protein
MDQLARDDNEEVRSHWRNGDTRFVWLNQNREESIAAFTRPETKKKHNDFSYQGRSLSTMQQSIDTLKGNPKTHF